MKIISLPASHNATQHKICALPETPPGFFKATSTQTHESVITNCDSELRYEECPLETFYACDMAFIGAEAALQ